MHPELILNFGKCSKTCAFPDVWNMPGRLPLSTSGGGFKHLFWAFWIFFNLIFSILEIISRICLIKYSEIFISGICWFYLSRICPEFFMYKKTGQTLDMKKFRTTKVNHFQDNFLKYWTIFGHFHWYFPDIPFS